MLNENAQLWVADLRANKDLQGRRRLHIISPTGEERFCCLGRACIVYMQVTGIELETMHNEEPGFGTVVYYENEAALLPTKVKEWLGLKNAAGIFNDDDSAIPVTARALTTQNDRGRSFEDIATLIESEPRGLFVEKL